MSVLNHTRFVTTVSEIITLTKSEIDLPGIWPLCESILEYRGKKALAWHLELRYDACTTLKTHHHSVSGSKYREPPGWPEMSSPAVKMPPHRSKAHNPEAGRSNRPPATPEKRPN